MDKEKKLKLYEQAILTWGVQPQLDLFDEEIGELLAAVHKSKRNKVTDADVITELADVSIMVEQLSILFGGYEEFVKEKNYKLERLEKRLNEKD